MNLHDSLTIALKAAIDAGRIILHYYNLPFKVEIKDDHSPVTIADKESQKIILSYLKTTPYPIISEEMETISYEDRKKWDYCWIVDPLDGTKEFFIKMVNLL
jgi:3'(2'), 5'-bisphosphate nucleotidase